MGFIKKNLKNGMLYILLIGILILLLSKKINYHIDEYLSYNFANVERFDPEEGVKFSPAGQVFLDFLVSDGKVDIKNIFVQLKKSCHPPFFYILLNMVSSLFPNTFSQYYAGAINIFFQVLTLFVFRKIISLLFNDEKTVFLISLFYVLCAGVLSITVFLRMYIMAMFWASLFMYIVLKNITHFSVSAFLKLLVVTVCGALSQYYFIIFAFFVSAVAVLMMAYEKRGKEILQYSLTMAGAGGISILIFPTMLDHIFSGDRGVESFENLKTSNFGKLFSRSFVILNKNIFGNLLLFLIVFFILFFVLRAILKSSERLSNCRFTKLETQRYLLLLIPSVLYFTMIVKIAPYSEDRYISPFYPSVIAGVIGLLVKSLKSLVKNETIGFAVCAILLSIICYRSFSLCKWPYLYESSRINISNAEQYGAKADAICLSEETYFMNPSFSEIRNCQSVTFYNVTDYDSFKKVFDPSQYQQDIAFFLIDVDTDTFLARFFEDHPEYSLANDNGKFAFARTFFLEKDY